LIKRQTNLTANIISFCQYLRTKDFYIGLQTEKECLTSLSFDPGLIKSSERFKRTLEVCFCKSKRDLDVFSGLFDRYWKELEKAVESKTSQEESPTEQMKNKQAPAINQLRSWLLNENHTEEIGTASYSSHSSIDNQLGLSIDENELKEMLGYVNSLLNQISKKRTRRYKDSKRKELINLRRSIRKNILGSDELLQLIYKEKKKKLRIVLLCDVSKSVELYSMFFLKFMFSLKSLSKYVEIFSFATSLHRLTEDINIREVNKSLRTISRKMKSWSGGTKIGKSLDEFMKAYSHKCIDKNTVVFIVSDGWDTGDIDLIDRNMDLLSQKSMKIIWLNPLLAHADWKPEVSGMKAALPYVDLLLPFHNIESLKSLSSL
jgi:uncharacterized protein with von Willebrand factor type A (vWA) domain